MGDIANMNDLERFARSPEGKAYLEEIRQMLLGRKIVNVTFANEVHYLATVLHLDDASTFVVFQPSLEVGAIQEQFEEVIEREYYVDFPDRRPTGASHEEALPCGRPGDTPSLLRSHGRE